MGVGAMAGLGREWGVIMWMLLQMLRWAAAPSRELFPRRRASLAGRRGRGLLIRWSLPCRETGERVGSCGTGRELGRGTGRAGSAKDVMLGRGVACDDVLTVCHSVS